MDAAGRAGRGAVASGVADLADIRLSGFGLGAARIHKDSLGHAL